MTAGAVKGEDVARYTAGARVPTADVAMATPFDFDFQYQKAKYTRYRTSIWLSVFPLAAPITYKKSLYHLQK